MYIYHLEKQSPKGFPTAGSTLHSTNDGPNPLVHASKAMDLADVVDRWQNLIEDYPT